MVILPVMNLEQFLGYKNSCPICNSNLSAYFHSKKKQTIIHKDNNFTAIFLMKGIKKSQEDYYVGYSINTLDNSFVINFYTKHMKTIEGQISISLLDRFRLFNDNLGWYRIYKCCNLCKNYNYSSNYFILDFKNNLISFEHERHDLNYEIRSECFGLSKECTDGYKIFSLVNLYYKKESLLNFGKVDCEEFSSLSHFGIINVPQTLSNILQMNLINFVGANETAERLDRLSIFL